MSNHISKKRILVAENDPNISEYLQLSLRMIGYDISGSPTTGSEAIKLTEDEKPNLVIANTSLQGAIDGIEAAHHINVSLNVPIVFIIDNPSKETLQRANSTNPYGYLKLPIDSRELRTIVENAIKQHESESRAIEKELLFISALDCITNGIIITNTNHEITYINSVAERITGLQLANVKGEMISKVVNIIDRNTGSPVDFNSANALIDDMVKDADSGNLYIESSIGDEIPIDFFQTPVVDGLGDNIGEILVLNEKSTGVNSDNSTLLGRGDSSLELLSNNPSDLVFIIDADFIINEYSQHISNVLGYDTDDIANKTFKDFIHPDDLNKFEAHFEKILNSNSKKSSEFRLVHHDQTCLIYEISGVKLEDNLYKGNKVFLNCRNITKLKNLQQKVHREKQDFQLVLNSINEGVIRIDINGKIEQINDFAEKLTGWKEEEAVGKDLAELLPIKNLESLDTIEHPCLAPLKSGTNFSINNATAILTKNRDIQYIAFSSSAIKNDDGEIEGAYVVFRDKSSDMILANELLKGDRLKSIDIISKSVVNDANNLLSTILGNLTLSKIYDKQAEKACFQLKEITERLKTFSKDTSSEMKVMPMEKLIKDTTYFATLDTNIECEYDISPNLLDVEVDETQFTQVIQNLIANSVNTMKDGQIIKISATNIEVQPEDELPLDEGSYVKISIIEDDCVITDENRKLIFDPSFQTETNAVNHGLSTVLSTIKNHHGHLEIDNDYKNGIKFNIYMPESTDVILLGEEIEPVMQTLSRPLHIVSEGKDDIAHTMDNVIRILIMDDDESLRDVTGKLLKYYGYEVSFASNGDEAITKYQNANETGKRFDIVIMDLNVPGGMGGKEATSNILEFDPKALVILSTGLGDDELMLNYQSFGFKEMVTKPFQITELNDKISKVMSDN